MSADVIASLAALDGVTTASGVAVRRSTCGRASGAGSTAGAGWVLPVREAFDPVLPCSGLRRGSTVAVDDSASLLFGLLAEATESGSWAAIVGMPEIGLVAAAEAGVAVSRLVLVPDPGDDIARVLATLLDGVDLVAVADVTKLAPRTARRLSDRARHRGAVLLPVCAERVWPGTDLRLSVGERRWHGPERGYGYLREREVTVRAAGRGVAESARYAVLRLPDRNGSASSVSADGALRKTDASPDAPRPTRVLEPVAG